MYLPEKICNHIFIPLLTDDSAIHKRQKIWPFLPVKKNNALYAFSNNYNKKYYILIFGINLITKHKDYCN